MESAPQTEAKRPRRLRIVNPHVLSLPDALISIVDVSASLGQSNSSTLRDIVDELMVTPVRKGKRCVRWVSGEVAKVRAARAAGADEATIRTLVRALIVAREAAAGKLAT